MIDFIKFYIDGTSAFEQSMLEEGKVDLKASKSFLTDNVDSYPKKGRFGNLEVVVNEKRAYIKGSIHKLENILTNEGTQNFDDFDFCQMSSTVTQLLDYFEVERNTSISQLELGLNLKIPMNPKRFLQYNLLMCDFNDHNKDLRFKSKGDFKEFQKTDYNLKIYNKSKQFELHEYILRVELKILTKRKLRKLGIFSLENLLERKVIEKLFGLLLTEIKKCTILDSFDSLSMPNDDREKLYRYTNPNYWKVLKDTKSDKVQRTLKKDFHRLSVKYNLLKTKNFLLKQMIEKFWLLMKCVEYNSLDIAA